MRNFRGNLRTVQIRYWKTFQYEKATLFRRDICHILLYLYEKINAQRNIHGLTSIIKYIKLKSLFFCLNALWSDLKISSRLYSSFIEKGHNRLYITKTKTSEDCLKTGENYNAAAIEMQTRLRGSTSTHIKLQVPDDIDRSN